MDTYLLLLYVTLDQEEAIQQLFLQHDWNYYKTDLANVTRTQGGCDMGPTAWGQPTVTRNQGGCDMGSTAWGQPTARSRTQGGCDTGSIAWDQPKANARAQRGCDSSATVWGQPSDRSSFGYQGQPVDDLEYRGQNDCLTWQNTADENPVLHIQEQNDTLHWSMKLAALDAVETGTAPGQEESLPRLNSDDGNIAADALQGRGAELTQLNTTDVSQGNVAKHREDKLEEDQNEVIEDKNGYTLLKLDTECKQEKDSDSKTNIEKVDQPASEGTNKGNIDKDSESAVHALKDRSSSRAAIKLRIEKGKKLFLEKKRRQREKEKSKDSNVSTEITKPKNNINNSGKKKCKIHCADCNVTFTSQRRFDSHKERNGGKCVFECEYCGKVFLYRRSKYLLHVRSAHTKERPHVCPFCQKGYVTSDKLKIHLRVHTGEKPCVCEQCGRSFYSRAELSIHKDYHHTSREPDQFKCDECNKTFCSQRYLLYHKNVTHSNSWDFSCDKCEKQFKCNAALQRHLKYIHTDKRNFKCEVCNKSFKSPACLRKHVVRHGGEKTFFCMECNKGFYERSKLAQHARVHTGEKPFHCDLCDYKCALAGNLTKHRKTHYKML